MNERIKTAALGGLIGTLASLLLVFGAIALGFLPMASDARLQGYLLTHPKLIYQMKALSDAEDSAAALKEEQGAVDKIGMKRFFDPAVAYVTGPANAKNSIVELYDYNCPHCRRAAQTLRKYYEKHKGDTRFAFIDFPIFGENSIGAARTSVAARAQGERFVAFHFGLMSETAEIDNALLLKNARASGLDVAKLTADIQNPGNDKALLAATRLAREAKFQGTPVFIIDGKVHEGEISEAEIKALLK
jgi:protein-disulfide isomerase